MIYYIYARNDNGAGLMYCVIYCGIVATVYTLNSSVSENSVLDREFFLYI